MRSGCAALRLDRADEPLRPWPGARDLLEVLDEPVGIVVENSEHVTLEL